MDIGQIRRPREEQQRINRSTIDTRDILIDSLCMGDRWVPSCVRWGASIHPANYNKRPAAAMRRRDGPRIIVPIRPPSSCICVRVSIARLALRMSTPSKTDPHPLSFDPTHPPTGGARAAVGIAVGIVVGGAHSQRRLPLPDHDTAHQASRRAFVPPLPSPRIDTNKASGLNQGVGAAAVGG